MRSVLYSEIRNERCNAAALGMFNSSVTDRSGVDENANLERDPISIKEIYSDVSYINPTSNISSSMGSYVTTMASNVAENIQRDLKKQLPEDSLAYKILSSPQDRYTEKQRWVIAYALQKNTKYVNKLGRKKYEARMEREAKEASSKAKLAVNKTASKPALDFIKSNKAKLGDYYKWLNTSSNPFRKERFSQKYTMESAKAFLEKK